MRFPSLKKGQVAVVQTEVKIGTVLTHEGHPYIGKGEVFLTFDTMLEAHAFAMNVVGSRPGVECALYNFKGKHLERITNSK